jgi:hypothetical protein
MMNQETNKEERLIQYLLGQLREEEQARIEERYFTDPDFHEELRATERDLIDRYVYGELSGREQEQFETHFLSSPRRRQKVEFARALRQSLAQAPAAAVAERAISRQERFSWWQSVLDFLGGRQRAWLLAAATVVILAGGWLMVRWQQQGAPNQGGQIAQQPPDQGAPRPPAPPVPPPEVTPPPRPEPTPPVRVATFVLTPSLARDSDETRKLAIEGNVQVRLQLNFEGGDYTSYRALLRTAEGDEVWRQDELTPRPTKSGLAVVVQLPASRFSRRDYTIRLSGVTAEGEVEEVSSYYFRVEKR